MKTKFCTSCKIEKPVSKFYPYYLTRCKVCTIKQVAKWQAKNKSSCAKYGQRYGEIWRTRHPEYNKEWRRRHLKKMQAYYRHYYKTKRATSVNWVLSNGVGRRLRLMLNSGKGGRHWEEILGYTVQELRSHLEKQFTPGMSWELFLQGKIHIDHRVPIAFFEYQKPEDWEFQYCWSLDNLQPMWALDNRKKSDKVNGTSRKRKSFCA